MLTDCDDHARRRPCDRQTGKYEVTSSGTQVGDHQCDAGGYGRARADDKTHRRGCGATFGRFASGAWKREGVDVHSDLNERAMGWGTARRENAAPAATDTANNPTADNDQERPWRTWHIHRVDGVADCVPQQPATQHAERDADCNREGPKNSAVPPQHAPCLPRLHANCPEHAEVVSPPTGNGCQRVHQNEQGEEGCKGRDNLRNTLDAAEVEDSRRPERTTDQSLETTRDGRHVASDRGDVGSRSEAHGELEPTLVVDRAGRAVALEVRRCHRRSDVAAVAADRHRNAGADNRQRAPCARTLYGQRITNAQVVAAHECRAEHDFPIVQNRSTRQDRRLDRSLEVINGDGPDRLSVGVEASTHEQRGGRNTCIRIERCQRIRISRFTGHRPLHVPGSAVQFRANDEVVLTADDRGRTRDHRHGEHRCRQRRASDGRQPARVEKKPPGCRRNRS